MGGFCEVAFLKALKESKKKRKSERCKKCFPVHTQSLLKKNGIAYKMKTQVSLWSPCFVKKDSRDKRPVYFFLLYFWNNFSSALDNKKKSK